MCDLEAIGAPSIFKLIRSAAALARMLSTLDLSWEYKEELPKQSDCVYYESIKQEIRLLYECRCNERLKAKAEGSTRLAYTGLRGGLEHLNIETRLRDETLRAARFMGECVILRLILVMLLAKKKRPSRRTRPVLNFLTHCPTPLWRPDPTVRQRI